MLEAHEKRILTVTCFGHFLSHFNMLVFPAITLPLSKHLGMSLEQVLPLSFWMYLLFGCCALPWGFVGDKLGAIPLMVLFFLGSGLCGLGAAHYIDDPAMFSLCLAGVGFFSAIYHPIGLGMVTKKIKRMTVGLGYNASFGSLGLATAPLLAGFLNWGFGLKVPFYLLGVLNLAGAGLMLLMPSLEENAPANGAQAAKPAQPAQPAQTASAAKKAAVAGSWGAFGILLISMMLGGITYRGTTVTLPAYLELNSESLVAFVTGLFPAGVTPNLVATTTASLVYLAGMVGQLIGGRVGDKHDVRWVYFTFHLCSLPAVFLMAYLSNLPLALATFVYVFFLLGMQPAENTLVARLTPESLRHSAFGAKFVLTFGIGALAVQLAAVIKSTWSMSAIFLCLACLTVPLLLAILALTRKADAAKMNGN